MNLLVIGIGIGIGHEKDLIIGYRYRFKFFILCIPTLNNVVHCSWRSRSSGQTLQENA